MRGERGSVLVQVAVSVLVLCGFCGLVVDYGMFWVARAEAQNAADAGALAGATAIAFDNVQLGFVAEDAALVTSQSNYVQNEMASTEVSADNASPCLIPGAPPPTPDGQNVVTCVKVDVYRDVAHGNPLPTFFARLFGVNEQGVHAQAKGAAAGANTTRCLAPLAIPDRWEAAIGTPVAWSLDPPSSFVRYLPDHSAAPIQNVYKRPGVDGDFDYGSGYFLDANTLSVANDPTPEVRLTLTQFTPADFLRYELNFGITTNQFVAVDTGGGFQASLEACNGAKWQIGQELPVDSFGSLASAKVGAQARVSKDSSARWDPFVFRVTSGCDCGISPRILVVPLFDVEEFERTRQDGLPTIRIVNFAGLYIDRADPLQGYLTTYPGSLDTSAPQVPYFSAFLRTGVLFR